MKNNDYLTITTMSISRLLFTTSLVFTSLLLCINCASAKTAKVACVGDSITYGATITNRRTDSYPAQLQNLLGHNFNVKNFGVNGCTMINEGNMAWTKTGAYKNATQFQPDIVIIKLGTNDSKRKHWKYRTQFLPDTLKLIDHFKSLPSQPRVIICTPLPGLNPPSNDQDIITAAGIKKVIPFIRKAAQLAEIELIDLHTEFSFFGKELKTILPDHVHPRASGAAHIALRVADQIVAKRGKLIEIEKLLRAKKVQSNKKSFAGYTGYQFQLAAADNAHCWIIAPKNPIAGAPWIWRARFFGHQPALDQALLDRGYYLAYCDISNLFGSAKAVNRWDKFYALTQELGLSKKPILEGMSRGGLIIFNWAKANPHKVAAIYADNPVCDIRSWPKKRSLADWKKCQAVWELKDSELAAFKGNPFDGLEVLSKAKVPIFLVLGKKDKVVPLAENGHILAERYKKLGGSITIWEKPNAGHHPHGLHPVFPLLRHLLHACGNPISPTLYQRANTQIFPPVNSQNRLDLLSHSQRILILGDSITYAGGYVSDFESWLITQPLIKNAKRKEVINLGLPSETVSGLSETGHAGGKFPRPDLHTRLDRILEKVKPDLIIACYGMNCGIYQPLNKSRFEAYKNGIKKLKEKAEKAGATIIFVTPPYFDNHGKSNKLNYADLLAHYSQWLVSQRANGWRVIDLNTQMTQRIHAQQVLNPKFTCQADRIHPNAIGHRMMAQSLIGWFSAEPTATTEALIKQQAIPHELKRLINQRMILMRDAWLTETKHTRPGIKAGLPIEQAKREAAAITKKINTILKNTNQLR